MRRRRSFWFALLLLLFVGTAALGTLAVLLKHEPQFYKDVEQEKDTDTEVAARVITRCDDLKNDMRARTDWSVSFTADELNALSREYWGAGRTLNEHETAGIGTSHRVAIEGDRIKIAARYGAEGAETFRTIVCLEFRVWLVKDELNTIAIELVDAHAGALPIGWIVKSKLDQVTELVRDKWNADVTWYRHEGHPTALLRFYAGQPTPPSRFRLLKIENGAVMFGGKSLVERE